MFNPLKTIGKGLRAIATFGVGSVGGLVVNYFLNKPDAVATRITDLIPSEISSMTVGSLIAMAIVMITNWLKHRNK